MKHLTIQLRLTAWYFLSLALIVAILAGGSWFAMRASMFHAIDRDLGYRMETVAPFIRSHSLSNRDQLTKAFSNSSESSVVGVFAQITDDQLNVLYEADLLRAHGVPVIAGASPDSSVSLSTVGRHGWPVRVASKHIVVDGVGLNIHIVEPLRDTLNALREYSFYLAVFIPIALLLTTTAGYWISRRALAPVEQIRTQAEAIDPADLAARLIVPPTEDELARLAGTLNAMLARIEDSFRSIEQFTADASHELRAPLALILTAGEVSLRRERTSEELSEVLRKIVREARHMSSLIENLLDLARGDARRRHTQFVPVDLTSLLRNLCSELTPVAVAKGLTLTANLPEDELRVLGEGTELRRLFLILLDNAIKYTQEGSIHIAFSAQSAHVQVSVADTGIGIDEASLPHVFDRFWRADKARSRAEGGAGLGLSLASQIVQRHGGTLSVVSQLDQGTTLRVQLPAAGPAQNF